MIAAPLLTQSPTLCGESWACGVAVGDLRWRLGIAVALLFLQGGAALQRGLLVSDPPRYDSVVAVGSRGVAASPQLRVLCLNVGGSRVDERCPRA